MGKVDYLTQKQSLIFKEVTNDEFFRSNFYFTGGTALSAFYLHHRESDDLDFFSEENFDSQIVIAKVNSWAKKYSFEFDLRQVENVNVFILEFSDKEETKVDFVTHPYKRIEKGKIVNNFTIDSLADIATNKLLTINQRTEVKDFVDLYFLLKTYTIWDLMEGLRIKFRIKTEPFLIASDFTKVEEFDLLPKMLVPLEISELKKFFKQKATDLAKRATE